MNEFEESRVGEEGETDATEKDEEEEEEEGGIGDALTGNLSLLVFSVVAWLFDLITTFIGSMQLNLFSMLKGIFATGIGAIAAAGVGIGAAIVYNVSDIAREAMNVTLGFTFGIQAFFSIIAYCLFIFIAASSPRGYFSFTDYIVATGVFWWKAFRFSARSPFGACSAFISDER